MLVVELPKDIVIYTDSQYNYIYAERKIVSENVGGFLQPKPENIGKEYFVDLGYYPTFESCWNGAIDYLGLKADDLKEYKEILDILSKLKELKFPKKEINLVHRNNI